MANYGGNIETTLSIGGLLEIVTHAGVTEYRHQIPAGDSAMVLYTRRSDDTQSTYYVTRDHLGSSTTVLDSTGTALVNLSFAAYGGRRNGAGWNDDVPTNDWTEISATTRRGFTGHEELDNVTAIHMNGRAYDPGLGRFMSADPIYVGNLADPQSLNPYSYVGNNPLNDTDPSGYSESSSPLCGGALVCGILYAEDPWPQDGVFDRHDGSPPINLGRIWHDGDTWRDWIFSWGSGNTLPSSPSGAGTGTSGGGGSSGGSTSGGDGKDTANTSSSNSTSEQQVPPPCTEGPSTATGSVSAQDYPGAGGGETVGIDDGHLFSTTRVGFGFGGGVSYNPHGGLPIQPADSNSSGNQRSVTLQLGFGIGVGPVALSINADLGIAYDSNSGFDWVHNIDPEVGPSAEGGVHGDVSVGGQVSIYDSAPQVYTGNGICRAHF